MKRLELWIEETTSRYGMYEGRLQSSWTGGSAPLLCRERRWLLC